MVKVNRLFIAEVKKQQSIKDLTYRDLERITGVPENTIKSFMRGARNSEEVKRSLAEALNIDI